MNNTPTTSIPMTTQQSTQPTIIQLEDAVPSSVPETTCMDDPTLIRNNSAKLTEDITESGREEVAPSCMDAYGSGPEPSLGSFPSPVQDVEKPNSS